MEEHAPVVSEDNGYIMVGVRLRPLMAGRGDVVGTTTDSATSEVIVTQTTSRPGGKAQLTPHRIPFSVVFERESNASVFETLGRPLVQQSLRGYNGTLMAYGQTGSGKTYTIGEVRRIGSKEHEGVAHRMVRALYEAIDADGAHTYEVAMQFCQVYDEKIYDLLDEDDESDGELTTLDRARKGRVALKLREGAVEGVHVQGASQEPAPSAEAALSLMTSGASRLAFASTNMNMRSSRSHAVCQLMVTRRAAPNAQARKHRGAVAGRMGMAAVGEGMSAVGAPPSLRDWRHKSVQIISNMIEEASKDAVSHSSTCVGKLSLVDLAGSEDVGRSGARGQALSEAKRINTSLLALGNVIQALTEGGRKSNAGGGVGHVPFRDSVLTRLLKESFGGNTKTTLLCCCSPAASDLTETLSTLRFGARAKRVRNHAVINATVDVNALNISMDVPLIAEQLQQQLDDSERLLEATRVRSEHAAARALQLAVRLRSEQQRAGDALRQSRAEGASAAATLKGEAAEGWYEAAALKMELARLTAHAEVVRRSQVAQEVQMAELTQQARQLEDSVGHEKALRAEARAAHEAEVAAWREQLDGLQTELAEAVEGGALATARAEEAERGRAAAGEALEMALEMERQRAAQTLASAIGTAASQAQREATEAAAAADDRLAAAVALAKAGANAKLHATTKAMSLALAEAECEAALRFDDEQASRAKAAALQQVSAAAAAEALNRLKSSQEACKHEQLAAVAAARREAEEAAAARARKAAEEAKAAAATEHEAAIAALTEAHTNALRAQEQSTAERLAAAEALHAAAIEAKEAEHTARSVAAAAAAKSECEAALSALREELKARAKAAERGEASRRATLERLQAEQSSARALKEASEEAHATQQRTAAELERTRVMAERYARKLEAGEARLREAEAIRLNLISEISALQKDADNLRRQLRISALKGEDSQLFPQMLSRWRRSHSDSPLSSKTGGSPSASSPHARSGKAARAQWPPGDGGGASSSSTSRSPRELGRELGAAPDRTADDRNHSTPMGTSVAETASEIAMKVDDDEALDLYDSV